MSSLGLTFSIKKTRLRLTYAHRKDQVKAEEEDHLQDQVRGFRKKQLCITLTLYFYLPKS
jgi:hypothetical protein